MTFRFPCRCGCGVWTKARTFGNVPFAAIHAGVGVSRFHSDFAPARYRKLEASGIPYGGGDLFRLSRCSPVVAPSTVSLTPEEYAQITRGGPDCYFTTPVRVPPKGEPLRLVTSDDAEDTINNPKPKRDTWDFMAGTDA